jgi:hypothetical protein
MILLTKPILPVKETRYLNQRFNRGNISGNGIFTQEVSALFRNCMDLAKSCLPLHALLQLEMRHCFVILKKATK